MPPRGVHLHPEEKVPDELSSSRGAYHDDYHDDLEHGTVGDGFDDMLGGSAIVETSPSKGEMGRAPRPAQPRTIRRAIGAGDLKTLLSHVQSAFKRLPEAPTLTKKSVRFRIEKGPRESWWEKITQVQDPRGVFITRWNDVCILFLCISFIRLPMYTAFGDMSVFSTFLATDLYFFADNLLALNTGYVYKGGVVRDRKLIFQRYMSWSSFKSGHRWSFYVCFLEFVPFYTAIALVSMSDLPEWVISVMAIFRLRRAYDFFRYFHDLEVSLRVCDAVCTCCLVFCVGALPAWYL